MMSRGAGGVPPAAGGLGDASGGRTVQPGRRQGRVHGLLTEGLDGATQLLNLRVLGWVENGGVEDGGV